MLIENAKTIERNYHQHLEEIIEHVWLDWTDNWPEARNNDALQEQTIKSAADAVNNAWAEGMTTCEWYSAALQILKS